MNKNSLKDAALIATAALLMGGLATVNALPGLATTVRTKAEATISKYVPQNIPDPIPNLPSIDQAFDVIGRDNV